MDTQLAIIYVRVSTNVQEDNYSFPTQLEACRNYAQNLKLTVVAEFQEVASGGSLNRPELEKVRAMIRSGSANVLIVYNTDRLSRNLGQLLYLKTELQQHSAVLHYATRGESSKDATGGLFENIEGAFAEYERLRIKDRLLTGRFRKIKGTDDKPAQVYGNGNAPYGYLYHGQKKARQLKIEETEAITVRQMFRWCLEGLSVHRIAERLNELEIPTSAQKGRASVIKRERLMWTAAMVYRIMTNEVYAGTMYFNKTHRVGTRDIYHPREEWIPVHVPAIIDKTVYEAVREKLAQGRKFSSRNAKRFYLLGRGKLKCQCGYTMTGTGSTKERWWTYRCTHAKSEREKLCRLGFVRAELVEELVWNWLYDALTPERIQEGIEAHQEMNASERATVEQVMAQLDKRREALDREAEKMIAAYKADVISLDELKRDKGVIDAERRSLDQEYARLEEIQREAVWHDADALLAEATALRSYMPLMNDQEKAALLDRVSFKALRRLDDRGKQVIEVECRLGAAMLPLDVPDIESPDGSSLKSRGYGKCSSPRRHPAPPV